MAPINALDNFALNLIIYSHALEAFFDGRIYRL